MAHARRLAGTLLNVAQELELADSKIKLSILDAARRGDSRHVEAVTKEWLVRPSTEVLTVIDRLKSKKPPDLT